MFTYREIAPSPALSAYVKCFWVLRATNDAPRTERVLPDASFELVFHIGEPFAGQPASMLIGEIRRPVLLRPSRRADVFGVRFHIGGVAPFLRAPAAELRDMILPLDEVLPSQAVHEAANTSERIRVVESMLLRRLAPPTGFGLARAATSLIARHRGALRIRDIGATIGTTERSLERAFDRCVGMSAKVYSRLTRFHSALRGGMDEYFDDSHRIRDFHDFSGTTPSELLREQNEMNQAFVGNVQD